MASRWGSNDPADNEPLMAAIGRIAVRSAELAEIIQAIIHRLDKAEALKTRDMMIMRRIGKAAKVAKANLSDYPSLLDDF